MMFFSSVLAEAHDLALIFCLFLLLELIWPRALQSSTGRVRGAVFWAITTVANSLTAVVALWAFRTSGVHPLFVLDLTRSPLGFFVFILAGDLLFYWMHRIQHAFLW